MTVDASSAVCNLTILEKLSDESISDMAVNWEGFCSAVVNILNGDGDEDGEVSFGSDLVMYAQMLFEFGLESLVIDHFFQSIEEMFEKKGALIFWRHFEPYSDFEAIGLNEYTVREDEFQEVLCGALEGMSTEKEHEERCLLMLVHALQSFRSSGSESSLKSDAERVHLFSRYQLIVASVLMASLPKHFPDLLHWYFKGLLETLSSLMEGGGDDDELPAEDMDIDERSKHSCRNSDMDIDEFHPSGKISANNKLVKSIGMVVRNLRNVGFTSMAEDAYASAIFCLLKAKVHDLAGDDYRNSVLQSIKAWIQAVPMHFLQALLDYLGDSFCYDNISSGLRSPLASRPSSCCFGTEPPSEELVRWQLRLEYFAYETLQDLRTEKLFDIIVDYPDSAPAIEDLKQCLDYTGQHSKLVDSFISSLRYRLLTAGASTNDILHQYVSTIKALRTIDPAGIFLEAVGEPIREYLRGRKDTIKCIVTMLTDGSGGSQNGPGSAGDSLLEELNRDEESQESSSFDDDVNTDDKQAWINAQNWEPDPVEADPLKGSRTRRKVDILGMIVGILGSKDQLVNEYRVMLAEKLLNKSDYDIDAEIRTLELLKIHFGESSMHKCEIMLNDFIDSKRTNTNIKATIKKQPHSGRVYLFYLLGIMELTYEGHLHKLIRESNKVLRVLMLKMLNNAVSEVNEDGVSLDAVNATIISSNFWPPIQDESVNLPENVDQLLSDYAKRFHEIKTPRKLLWKKNLGTVKLELQFEDRAVEFMVTPLHASIIMQFQDKTSWTSANLAVAVGVPVDVLSKRINFWISKGIIAESAGASSSDHSYTLVEAETGKGGATSGGSEELLVGDEEGDRSVASVEDQLRKEMTIYEKFITGMLTNFGSMALDRIHNTLKMFCLADPSYDKSIHQLQSFLSGLVAEEKLEFREGMYFLKK